MVILWSSDRPDVASVLDDTIEARGSGFAILSATTASGRIYTVKVTVKAKAVVSRKSNSRKPKKRKKPYIPDYTEGRLLLFFPLGSMGDVSTMGMGIQAGAFWNDIVIKRTFAGPQIGVIPMLLKDESTESHFILPLYATAGYAVDIMNKIVLKPQLSLGLSYNSMSYKDKSETSFDDSFWLPLLQLGLTGNYRLQKNIILSGGIMADGFIESDGIVPALEVSAGGAYIF